MKKLSVLLIICFILVGFPECKKSDFSDEPPIPSLAYVDISGAKFFLCSKKSENEYDFTKLSEQGIETSVAFMDENQQPVDLGMMGFPNFIFSLDEYVGMAIYWKKSKDVGNMSYAQTVIFYLIRKTDGKVLASYDATESDEIVYGTDFNIDQYNNFYFKSGLSLYRFRLSKYTDAVTESVLIDQNIEKYFLASNGDLAYTKANYGIIENYFKFTDGSTMKIPYQNVNPEKYYESPAITELGLTTTGKICANYKNANGYTCQLKILTEVEGRHEFLFCNSSNEELDDFYCVGDQLWGVIANSNNLKFINYSVCGNYTEYPNYLQNNYNIYRSHNFFYYYDNETKKVYRFLPGNGAPYIWKSFPDEMDLRGVYYSFSKDEYSIFEAYYNSPEPTGRSRYFFLDNDGNTIAERDGNDIYRYLVL